MRVNLQLKFAILAAGTSQRDAAAQCDISEDRFSEIVRGWTEPRDAERQAIAEALGKCVDDLFGQEHEGVSAA